MMNAWDIFWGAIITVLAILDLIVSRINVKYSLSYLIWRGEGITRTTANWSLTRYIVLVFLVWAILHLVFRKVP